jgi:predicted chitinase
MICNFFRKNKITSIIVAETLDVIQPEMEKEKMNGLHNADAFYSKIRAQKLFGPTLDTKELEGLQEILKDCAKAKWPMSYVAYALATAYHETAHTMQPIKEFGGTAYYTKLYDVNGRDPARARLYGNTSPGDGAKYCGRGYVQLTWKVNYAKAGKELGIDLVNKPDQAMIPDIASDIMVKGMEQGWFSGKKLSTYLPASGPAALDAYVSARRIINGTDKAALIAEYAMNFQEALKDGDWH